MGNRFGFKDLIIVVLLVTVIGLVLLSMKQYDRQWEVMQSINTQLKEHTGDLADIRRQIKQGVSVVTTQASVRTPTGDEWQGAGVDPFERIEAAEKMAGYSKGDWLKDSFGTQVAKITPLVSRDAYGATIQSNVMESLIQRDPVTFQWQPVLAESWKISEDGLTYRFKLRKDTTYSDGVPVKAQDFKYMYDWTMNPEVDCPTAREMLKKIVSCTVINDYEVEFKFDEPFFSALELAGGMSPLPKHFYSKYSAKEFNAHPGLLLGTGPYRMETPDGWSTGKPLILYRNQRYWGKAPGFDRMVYDQVDNPKAQVNMYRNKELDMLMAQPEQLKFLKEDPEVMSRSNVKEYERITGGYGFIAWNQKRNGQPTAFADKRVRQAMSYLMDYERLHKQVLLGYGIPVTGPFNRGGPQADKSLMPYTTDVAKAQKLLEEAGFKKGPDGVILAPDGKPFRFKITIPTGTGFWEKVMLSLKDNMAKVGVQMDIDPLEWAVFDEHLKQRDFDALCMAWGSGIESDIYQMFDSSQWESGGDNFTAYKNPELDKLIAEARRTIDEDKRMKLWQACHRLLYEDQPYTFLYTRRAIAVIDKRIQNVQVIPVGLNGREEWFVPKGQQRWKD